MANIMTFFLAAVLCLIGMAFAAPRPHTGMINDEKVMDVGVVYPQANYGGTPTFLLLSKQGPQCMQLRDPDVVSIMICIEGTECDFFWTTDCGAESGELPQFTVGHGNVQELPKDQLRKYWSYKCYAPGFSHVKHDPTIQLQTTPHDSSKDVKHGMAW